MDDQTSGDGGEDSGWECRIPLTGSEDVPKWLQACADILDADGAVLVATSARCPDVRRVLHSTDPAAEQVADTLYVLGAGPDVDALAVNDPRSVTVADPDDAERWPLLIDELTALDIEWVQAYPLGPGAVPIGTLQLHRRRATQPQERSRGCEVLVAKLARVLGVLVAEQVQSKSVRAHEGGDVVNMAIGVLMARHTLTSDAASALLRAGAYARGHTSTTEAGRIIDSIGRAQRW
jgi:hypothetical protein